MKKCFLLLSLLSFSSIFMSNSIAAGPAEGYVIHNYFQPKNEQKGLYIVNFNYYSYTQDLYLTYRIYCPTKTVRNISKGIIGVSRTAKQEDQLQFNNDQVLQAISKQICFSNK